MLNSKPPFGFISGGKVYRKDDDATHLPMFHQIGVMLTKMCLLRCKDLINKIVVEIFGHKTI